MTPQKRIYLRLQFILFLGDSNDVDRGDIYLVFIFSFDFGVSNSLVFYTNCYLIRNEQYRLEMPIHSCCACVATVQNLSLCKLKLQGYSSQKKKRVARMFLSKKERLQAYVWEDGDKIWIGKGETKGHDFVAVPM